MIGRQPMARRKIVFPNDTQRDTAIRIGVGFATYSRMERGDDKVSLRHYLDAATILKCEKSFHSLFVEPDVREGLIEHALRELGQKKERNSNSCRLLADRSRLTSKL